MMRFNDLEEYNQLFINVKYYFMKISNRLTYVIMISSSLNVLCSSKRIRTFIIKNFYKCIMCVIRNILKFYY